MTIKTYIINSMQNTIVDIIEYEPVVHEFTESGTYYKSPNVNSISVISVGGGGAGGGSSHLIYGGEGGYAGEISYNYYTDIDDSLNIIIGDGGLGAPDTIGASGGNTSVGDLQTSIGGNGGVKHYIAYEIGGDGEDGYGNVQLATDGSAYSTSGNVAPGIGGVGYGAGGGGSGCRIFFTNYSGGNGAPGYVKITEYIPIEYKITEPGIYHIVAVDDSNNLLRAYTAPSLKITDARRAYTETQADFTSDIIFSGYYTSFQTWISAATLILDSEFHDWSDLQLTELNLSIDIYVNDSENIDVYGMNEIAFWCDDYNNKLYYELTPIFNQLIPGEYVNFVIPLSNFTDSNFNILNAHNLSIIITPDSLDSNITVEFKNAKLTLPKTSGFVNYNNVAVQNCKVISILDGEIIDVTYTDEIGRYEIYAPENSIIVAEPTNNTTERPKVVI